VQQPGDVMKANAFANAINKPIHLKLCSIYTVHKLLCHSATSVMKGMELIETMQEITIV
jgi:hypothetical protein